MKYLRKKERGSKKKEETRKKYVGKKQVTSM